MKHTEAVLEIPSKHKGNKWKGTSKFNWEQAELLYWRSQCKTELQPTPSWQNSFVKKYILIKKVKKKPRNHIFHIKIWRRPPTLFYVYFLKEQMVELSNCCTSFPHNTHACHVFFFYADSSFLQNTSQQLTSCSAGQTPAGSLETYLYYLINYRVGGKPNPVRLVIKVLISSLQKGFYVFD